MEAIPATLGRFVRLSALGAPGLSFLLMPEPASTALLDHDDLVEGCHAAGIELEDAAVFFVVTIAPGRGARGLHQPACAALCRRAARPGRPGRPAARRLRPAPSCGSGPGIEPRRLPERMGSAAYQSYGCHAGDARFRSNRHLSRTLLRDHIVMTITSWCLESPSCGASRSPPSLSPPPSRPGARSTTRIARAHRVYDDGLAYLPGAGYGGTSYGYAAPGYGYPGPLYGYGGVPYAYGSPGYRYYHRDDHDEPGAPVARRRPVASTARATRWSAIG